MRGGSARRPTSKPAKPQPTTSDEIEADLKTWRWCDDAPPPRADVAALWAAAQQGTHARRRDFVIETRIADGGAGRVYRGTFRGIPAALKEVRLEGLSVDEPGDAAAPGFFAAVPPARAVAEAALLRSLRCPDVVAAVGCFSECGRLFTVLELGTRDLLEVKKAWGRRRAPEAPPGCVVPEFAGRAPEDGATVVPEPAACFYAARVLEALAHLHERRIVYGDLKPENVLLLGTHGRPVLCDFDRARDEREPRPRPGGSPEYAPPELLDAGAAGPAGDVYQLGVLLYELLAGATPFKASSVDRTLALVARGAVPPPPAACSRAVAALLAPTASGLLTSKPKLRPRAAALRDRPVFAAARDMDPPELPD